MFRSVNTSVGNIAVPDPLRPVFSQALFHRKIVHKSSLLMLSAQLPRHTLHTVLCFVLTLMPRLPLFSYSTHPSTRLLHNSTYVLF
jgi:hypothetical protein